MLYDDDGDGDGDDANNCSSPRKHSGYNSSCEFVRAMCGDEAQLFDYLQFILCGFPSPRIQVRESVFSTTDSNLIGTCEQRCSDKLGLFHTYAIASACTVTSNGNLGLCMLYHVFTCSFSCSGWGT